MPDSFSELNLIKIRLSSFFLLFSREDEGGRGSRTLGIPGVSAFAKGYGGRARGYQVESAGTDAPGEITGRGNNWGKPNLRPGYCLIAREPNGLSKRKRTWEEKRVKIAFSSHTKLAFAVFAGYSIALQVCIYSRA